MEKFLHIIFHFFSIMVFHFRCVILKRKLTLIANRKELHTCECIDLGVEYQYRLVLKYDYKVLQDRKQINLILKFINKLLFYASPATRNYYASAVDDTFNCEIRFWMNKTARINDFLLDLVRCHSSSNKISAANEKEVIQ